MIFIVRDWSDIKSPTDSLTSATNGQPNGKMNTTDKYYEQNGQIDTTSRLTGTTSRQANRQRSTASGKTNNTSR